MLYIRCSMQIHFMNFLNKGGKKFPDHRIQRPPCRTKKFPDHSHCPKFAQVEKLILSFDFKYINTICNRDANYIGNEGYFQVFEDRNIRLFYFLSFLRILIIFYVSSKCYKYVYDVFLVIFFFFKKKISEFTNKVYKQYI